MSSTIRNLSERRVPQVLAVYLGAAFGVVQFVDFVGSRYLLPAVWTDLALLTMALLLPSVLLYTYNHGRRGPDDFHRSEKVFIPINLLILVALVTVVGAGAPLAPTSKRITVMDEKGNSREAVVANKAYRKRVAVFMFDSPADSAVAWLQFGLPQMAIEDLQQSNFVEAVPSIYMRDGLQKVGYAKGVNVPLSLKRDVVNELHVPHFMTGRIEKAGAEYVASVQTYATASAKLIAEHTYRGTDPTQIADQISAGLLKDLEVPVLTDAKPDMPVSEILSEDSRAVRAYLEGIGALYMNMDWATANAKIAEAVKLDPTFASAHFSHFVLARVANQPQLAQSAVKAALDHSYRLPERTREFIKANYYVAKEDWQHAYAVLEMLAQLYPDDIQVQLTLVEINTVRDNKDALITSLKKVLELDPSRNELLLKLGTVYESRGDSKQALAQYEKYAKKLPNDVNGPRHIGGLQRRLGSHAAAKASFEKALLIKPEDSESLRGLARVHAVLGEFELARQKTAEAMAAAKTAPERWEAFRTQAWLHNFRGEIAAGVKSTESSLAELATFAPQLGVLQYSLLVVGDIARIDAAAAQRKLDELRRQLSAPPGSLFLPIAEIPFYIETGDAARAQQTIARLDAVIKQNSWNFLASVSTEGHGALAQLQGDHDGAVKWYREALKADPHDATYHTRIARSLRNLKRAKEAEAEIAKALRITPADGEANLEMGLLMKEAGDEAKARAYLNRALQTWQNAHPNYKPARQAREAYATRTMFQD